MSIWEKIQKRLGIKTRKEKEAEHQVQETARKDREWAQFVMRLPTTGISKENLEKIPKPEKITHEFLKKSPLDSWFICPGTPSIPGIIIIGQVVKGEDIFCNQWGAGLGYPGVWYNKYRAVILAAA